jgi:4-hydroxy-tetrahydrodipicolinate reductase
VTRLAIVGAAGRTGRLVIDVLPEFQRVELVAAVVSPGSPLAGVSVPNAAGGMTYSSDIVRAAALADVTIDFSRPDISVAVAQACARAGKPCLIATTGHTNEQQAAIAAAAAQVAVLIAPNTSAGVYVATQLARLAARLLGDSVDIEIVELHHRGKRDAPSGTAKALAAAVSEQRQLRTIVHRSDARRDDELGVTSLRGGDVAGEHTVYFLGRGERIELTHRATDRAIFARGAIRLAEKLAGLGPGLKQLADFF